MVTFLVKDQREYCSRMVAKNYLRFSKTGKNIVGCNAIAIAIH